MGHNRGRRHAVMKTKVSLMFNKKANVFAVPESINSS